MLKSRGQKMLKSIHLFAAALWIGGVVCSLFAVTTLPTMHEPAAVLAVCNVFELLDYGCICVGAMLIMATACIYGLCTPWRFFRNRWIVAKWAGALAIIVSGSLLTIPSVDSIRKACTSMPVDFSLPAYADPFRLLIVLLSSMTILLFSIVLISVFKPRIGIRGGRPQSSNGGK